MPGIYNIRWRLCLSGLCLFFLYLGIISAEDATDAAVERQIHAMAKEGVVFRGSRVADASDTDFQSPYVQGANALNAFGYAAVPGLRKLLTDEDPRAVIAAADMLLSIGDPANFAEAAVALERVRSTLKGTDFGSALYLLVRLTGHLPCELDPEKVGRDAYIQTMLWLKWFPHADAEKFALTGLESKDRGVRMASAGYLAERASSAAAEICLKKLANPEGEVIFVVASLLRAAAQHSKPEALKLPLEWALDQEEMQILYLGVGITLDLKMEALLPQVEKALKVFAADARFYPTHLLQARVMEKLIAMNSAGAHAILLKFCQENNFEVREMAISALGAWTDKQSVEALKEATDDENGLLRFSAIKALARLSAKFPEAQKCIEEFAQRKVRDNTDDRTIILSYLWARDIPRADAYFETIKASEHSSQILMECAADSEIRKTADRNICDFFVRALGTLNNVRNRRISLDNVLESLSGRPFAALEPLLLMHGRTRTWDVDKELARPFPELCYDAAKLLPDDEGALIKLLESPGLTERTAAVWKLWSIGTHASLPALEKAAKDPSFSDGSIMKLAVAVFLWNNKFQDEAYILRPQALAAIEAIKGRK